MSTRYRLDDLGWVQFEGLVQALLKADLGLAVESWSGVGDNGCDAYTSGPLGYPDRSLSSPGPFVFQIKFVSGANAAGARWKEPLVAGVKAEVSRIQRRRDEGVWQNAMHYTLVTNAPLNARSRQTLQDLVKQSVEDACGAVHCLGSSDVCDLLDAHPEVRQSYPQILGLRDLEGLLRLAVNHGLLLRGDLLLQSARDLSSVFVPTEAYRKAFRILGQHHFVMLEGPPEMGKTAIAHTIALVQATLGWDVVSCSRPEDLFAAHKAARQQVFVADDAFGRTEYDVARGRSWEAELERALQVLDPKHWLVWTSRKHILERAKRDLDLQGKAGRFPKPADVLVDASNLSVREKALILYRHAKAWRPDAQMAEVVRRFAVSAVDNPHFTPERIRRVVTDRLDDFVVRISKGDVTHDGIVGEVREAIRNPTERMRRAFVSLPVPHKWMLVCLLEEGGTATEEGVKKLYEQSCPAVERSPFAEVVEDLRESFIRDRWGYVTWMHPSYRDVVIDELCADPKLRQAFLQNLSLEGVKLALSDTGGAAGDRVMPVMVDDNSWKVLGAWILRFVVSAPIAECIELLQVVSSAIEVCDESRVNRLRKVLGAMCEALKRRWDAEGIVLRARDVSAFASATLWLDTVPPMPSLVATWEAADARLASQQDRSIWLDSESLSEWSEVVDAIRAAEPRLLAQRRFPRDRRQMIENLLASAGDEVDIDPGLEEPADMRAESDRLLVLAEVVGSIAKWGTGHDSECAELRQRLISKARALEDRANEEEGAEPEPDFEVTSNTSGFDVPSLFADL